MITGVEVTGIVVSPEPPKEDFSAFLRRPGFSVVLRGYDRARVDELLERARQVLSGRRPDFRTALVQDLSQPIPVRMRGYDREQVDGHLGRVSKILALTSGT
jgi:hypothetical protein